MSGALRQGDLAHLWDMLQGIDRLLKTPAPDARQLAEGFHFLRLPKLFLQSPVFGDILRDADNAFPVSPLRAIQNWARDRLRANGQGGPARFVIADATANITDLPVKGGLSGTFTDQVSQKYDIAVDAALELFDQTGVVLRSARVTVSRSATVLQSASANERARTRYNLVRDLMSEFDRQAQARISSGFGQYLLPG